MPEQTNFVKDFRRSNNPCSETYNPGWSHPNFAWDNNERAPQQTHPPPEFYPPPEKKPSLEDLMTTFVTATEARFQKQEASIRNLETQIGQLANYILNGPQGTLPSNTERNPKEDVQAITLCGGKEIEGPSQQTEKESEKTATQKEKSVSWDSSPCFQISGSNEIAQVDVQAEVEEKSSTTDEIDMKPKSSETITEGAPRPKLELKPLPSRLKYSFLDCNSYSVPVSAVFTGDEDNTQSEVLRKQGEVEMATMFKVKGHQLKCYTEEAHDPQTVWVKFPE